MKLKEDSEENEEGKYFERYINYEMNPNKMILQKNEMKQNKGDKCSLPKKLQESNIKPNIERNVESTEMNKQWIMPN